MAESLNRPVRKRITLNGDGAEHSWTIPQSEQYRRCCVQADDLDGTLVLEGSVNGTTFYDVGVDYAGAAATLAADGQLFYAGACPILLRIRYTTDEGEVAPTATVILTDTLLYMDIK